MASSVTSTHRVKGYSAVLPKGTVEDLRSDPRVEYVTLDHRLHFFEQSIPTGIDRIFASTNEELDIDGADDHRTDVDVAVIDTGIDEHEDLNVVERTDCTNVEKAPVTCVDGFGYDYFGHGTHVAGIVGSTPEHRYRRRH